MAMERSIGATDRISGTIDVSASPSGPDGQPPASQLAALQAENLELRCELEQLRADRGRLFERQRRIMELLNTTNVEHLVHDLRNVLNERELLRTLAEGQLD
jgi:hypothetical protein